MDLLKHKYEYFTPEELAAKKIVKKKDNASDKEIKSAPVNQVIDLERFRDTEGLTIKTLDTGFWFVKNRQKLILIRNYFLIFLGVLFWGFFFSVFGTYFVFGMKNDSIMLSRLTYNTFPGHKYFEKVSPDKLKVENVYIFEAFSGHYDFLTKVKNSNTNYWVDIEYEISGSGKVIATGMDVILPGEDKYVMVLGKELDWSPSEVSFRIIATHWRRVDAHKYGNWNNYKKDRLDGIVISDINTILSEKNPLSEKINLNSVNFKVKNNTSFNYLEASFVILLLLNNRPVSVHSYTLSDFYSGLEKDVSIVFPGQFSAIDAVKIVPDINIIDNNIFSEFNGKGELK